MSRDSGDGYGLKLTPYTESMTLRDWFAGQALMGMLSVEVVLREMCEDPARGVAKTAYSLADAMLEARK